jgi:hypothetical protein
VLHALLHWPPFVSFRFSGGLAGPGVSIAGRLTGRCEVLAHPEVQGQPRVSTTVLSAALATSAWIAMGVERNARDERLYREWLYRESSAKLACRPYLRLDLVGGEWWGSLFRCGCE